MVKADSSLPSCAAGEAEVWPLHYQEISLPVLFLKGGQREAQDYNCPFTAFLVLFPQQATDNRVFFCALISLHSFSVTTALN